MGHLGVIECCCLAFLLCAMVPRTMGHEDSAGVTNVSTVECATIRYHISVIDTLLDGLCGPVPTPEPKNPEEWESIPLTQIGTINLGSTADQPFAIPATVPNTASEVLVYVYVRMGNTHGGLTHVRIYTQKSEDRRFDKYLTNHAYPQDAHTYTADNMWFPLTTERRVHVVVSKAVHTTNTDARIYVIGYR